MPDQIAGMGEVVEQGLVQELVPHPAVEAFDKAVLHPFTGRDVVPFHLVSHAPPQDHVDGETHALDQSKKIVVKFPRLGGYVLALQLWESDSEQGSDQYQIGQTLFTGLSEEVREGQGNGGFLDELGRSLGEDWSLDQFEATPFYRGEFPALGETTRYDNVGWIDGGNSRSFDLGQSVLELINGAAIGNWQ